MNVNEIQKRLFELQDIGYRDFQSKLLPAVDKERIIGVRTPQLKNMAKLLLKDPETAVFLEVLPHRYFDEDQLHAFIISGMKNYDECIARVEKFLPFVDNWATCDQLSPAVFKKHRNELLEHIKVWIASGKTYVIRFGAGMLMQHYLDDDFDAVYPEMVAGISSEEYYVNMMRAWYFATALAKQYDAVLPYIENNRLDLWTHNKTIQKAIESRRISEEQKSYLRSLKRKG